MKPVWVVYYEGHEEGIFATAEAAVNSINLAPNRVTFHPVRVEADKRGDINFSQWNQFLGLYQFWFHISPVWPKE